MSPWNAVVLLYRRMCVLRAQELYAEAEEFRVREFAQALAAVDAQIGTDEDGRRKLEALFAMEEERVANASVLAAMLAPMLREQLRPEPAHFSFASSPAASAAAPASETAELEAPASGSRPPLSIADFIDGMLRQEKPASPHAAHRRAS